MKTNKHDKTRTPLLRQYIYLTLEEKLRVKELSNSNDLSVSNFISNLIRHELDKTPVLNLKIDVGGKI